MPSFSSSVKAYLCEKSFEELGFGEKERVKWKECCSKSFLRAVFLHLAKEEETGCVLSSDREMLLELSAFLLIRVFGIEAEVKKRDRGNFRGAILLLPSGTRKEILDQTKAVLSNSCDRCRVLAVRAALLSCGTVLDPEKGYHAAFRCVDFSAAEELLFNLNLFDIDAKITKENDHDLIYIKESAKIEDLLSLVGAQKFSLDLMDKRVGKSIRANTNRRQNFDNANMTRAVNGAQSVILAIHYLQEEGILKTLSEPLQLAAKLRLNHPEVSLSELCRFSEAEITKSGLNHRLQKLVALAEKHKIEKESDQ